MQISLVIWRLCFKIHQICSKLMAFKQATWILACLVIQRLSLKIRQIYLDLAKLLAFRKATWMLLTCLVIQRLSLKIRQIYLDLAKLLAFRKATWMLPCLVIQKLNLKKILNRYKILWYLIQISAHLLLNTTHLLKLLHKNQHKCLCHN